MLSKKVSNKVNNEAKGILIVVVLILVLLTSITYAENIRFPDVRQEWMKVPVRWGVQNKIVVGYNDGTFKPNNQVTEAEFSTMMARYVKVVDVDNIVKEKGKHWSQGIYDVLERYAIPLKGYKDNKAKDTGLSRGQLARIVAAKNGFNLNERQAVYYLYENDLSFGKIDGRLDFESYDAKSAVKRAEAVAFLQRLDSVGITTFKGKPSPVSGSDMAGIKDVPKDPTVITDKDFDDLAKEKGIEPKANRSRYDFANKVADKYGYTVGDFSTGVGLRDKDNNTALVYEDTGVHYLEVYNYHKNKNALFDLLKGLGDNIDPKEIDKAVAEHMKDGVPKYRDISVGEVEVSGHTGEDGHITLVILVTK